MKTILKAFGSICCGVTFVAGALGLIGVLMAGFSHIDKIVSEKEVKLF